ncbi:MAG: putative membrane protein [Candidatus Azotimanducaceae bacterium]|jgi:uncharacterized membrane protein
MNTLIVLPALLAVATIVVVFVLFSRSKQGERREQVKEIDYLLDRVAEAAKKRKTQLYEALGSGENASLAALKIAAENTPENVSHEVRQIETLWARLSEQLAEFSDQSVQSTLQSSVVTTRAAMTADEITRLVAAVKTKLSSYR